jgi:hypothetical protein
MPLKPPYLNKFNPGDLLYGLALMRNFYGNNYMGLAELANDSSFTCVIDDYAANELQKNYFERIGEKIPKNQDDFYQVLTSHPKYKSIFIDHPYQTNFDNIDHIVLSTQNIARKCKTGLYWAAKYEKNFSIHFILDEIDINEVIFKSNEKDHPHADLNSYLRCYFKKAKKIDRNIPKSKVDKNLSCKSITGSELRWIYRNKDDPKVQKSVQFWYKGKPCCPPWDPYFDQLYGERIAYKWLKYMPKSLQVYMDSTPSTSSVTSTQGSLIHCEICGSAFMHKISLIIHKSAIHKTK